MRPLLELGFVLPPVLPGSHAPLCQLTCLRCPRRQRATSMNRTVPILAAFQWETVADCPVLTPVSDTTSLPLPVSLLVHFMGGFLLGSKPEQTYKEFLERLMVQLPPGSAIVATPFDPVPTLDHVALATRMNDKFGDVRDSLQSRAAAVWIPEVGLGHSLGAKLHILLGALRQESGAPLALRAGGNVLMSYNNFSAADSVPDVMKQRFGEFTQTAPEISPFVRKVTKNLRNLSTDFGWSIREDDLARVEQFADSASTAFSELNPSPDEVRQLIRNQYSCAENLVVQFANDNIDQSPELMSLLTDRFDTGAEDGTVARRRRAVLRVTPGSHLTPNYQVPDLDEFNGRGADAAVESVKRGVEAGGGDLDQLVVIAAAYIGVQVERLRGMQLGAAAETSDAS